jgi:membrane protein required for beta-lactamase induction
MIIPMPHVYEFQIDGKPIARMNFPFTLSNNDMAGIKLTLANREEVSVDRVKHVFEWVNLGD